MVDNNGMYESQWIFVETLEENDTGIGLTSVTRERTISRRRRCLLRRSNVDANVTGARRGDRRARFRGRL